jgi:predicted O-methyltransferase YrrM
MANRTIEVSEVLYDYLVSATLRESEVGRRLREETAKMSERSCQISPDQGQFMGLLVELLGGRRALEIGTFTGYSALCVALHLPQDGKLVACDVSTEWTNVGRRFWKEAGVDHKIDLRIAPALDTLGLMLSNGDKGTFDFAFIDADKLNYDAYYEAALELLRPGGLITIDNVLWAGKVADNSDQSAETVVIRTLNEKIRNDPRVSCSLVPIGDGLMLARKR